MSMDANVVVLGDGPAADAAAAVLGAERGGEGGVTVLVAEGPPAALAAAVRDARSAGDADLVVLLAPEVPPGAFRRLIAAGAAGIVLEAELEPALAIAVQAALAGQTCVPRAVAAQADPASLSVRERQLLGMIVLGMSNAEIAGQLHLTESTVKNHLTSAFAKLGVRSRNEARALLLDPEGGLGLGVLTIPREEVEA